MAQLPQMTEEQRREALQKAGAARRERTRALAKLTDGSVTLTAVLDDEENPLQRAFVRQVLRALPGIGTVRADRIMADIRIDAKRRVAGLGARQRDALRAQFAVTA